MVSIAIFLCHVNLIRDSGSVLTIGIGVYSDLRKGVTDLRMDERTACEVYHLGQNMLDTYIIIINTIVLFRQHKTRKTYNKTRTK